MPYGMGKKQGDRKGGEVERNCERAKEGEGKAQFYGKCYCCGDWGPSQNYCPHCGKFCETFYKEMGGTRVSALPNMWRRPPSRRVKAWAGSACMPAMPAATTEPTTQSPMTVVNAIGIDLAGSAAARQRPGHPE